MTVPETGEYRFATTSDDGSQLWIDGRHVVDNGGDPRYVDKEQHGLEDLERDKADEDGVEKVVILGYN